jgi:hypothetical protein
MWGGSVSPTLRWAFHPAWWLEASATGDRRTYDDHSDDNRIGTGQVRLSWKPLGWLETRLTTSRRWRNYDTRVQYNDAGFPEAGSKKLKIAEREAELRFDLTWDKAESWKTTTRAGLQDYRDNGSGYFNYRMKSVSQELSWETNRWLADLEASASRIDFDLQKVGLGDPPPLLKDGYTGTIRLERVLSPRWTVFAVYTWERRRSNDEIASYVVNEGLLGLRWSWVK